MRYLGSKERIANDITPIMLGVMQDKEINTFIDGFCGGCSIIQRIPDKFDRIANDSNPYLIAMWKKLTTTSWQPPSVITKEMYDAARDSHTKKDGKVDDAMIGWIGFMASRYGRFFAGYTGHNVDKNSRDYIGEAVRNINRQPGFLQGITWYCGSYDNINAPRSSFIYYDPPYKGTTGYSSSGKFDHDSFYDYCRQMHRDGHTVYISEYQMPGDFSSVWQKEINNTVRATKTTKALEQLWTINPPVKNAA